MRKVFITGILVLCLTAVSFSASADPVVAPAESYGPGMAGPGTGDAAFTDAVKAETTLLRTDDPVSLYENASLGLGGAKVIMIKGTQENHHLCLVVETSDGKRIVVDGGSGVNTEYLYRYLCENGGTVDAWLITHPHHDHAGALFTILSDPAKYPLSIGKIYCATSCFPYLNEHEDTDRRIFTTSFGGVLDALNPKQLVRDAAAGTVFKVGTAEVKVLNVPFLYPANTGNNSSVSYRITLGEKSLLVVGDTGEEAAANLLGSVSAEDLKADILMLAHHGQAGGSRALYQAVSPEVALWPSSASIWNRTKESAGTSESPVTPAVTMKWLKEIGVTRNYSMSYGNWILK